MYPFWRTKTGKLFIGGCGTQIGLLFALGGLLVLLLFCSICVTVNILSVGLNRLLAGPPTTVASGQNPASSPAQPAQAETTLIEINRLLTELELLQVADTALPAPAQTGPNSSAKPLAVVNQSGVYVRSGPGPEYGQVGALAVGEKLEIVGRNVNSNWWLVALPNGLFAWLPAESVDTLNAGGDIPVVAIPDQLVQPAASNLLVSSSAAVTPTATVVPTPLLPPGTPTPSASQERQFVEQMPAYQRVIKAMFVPPVSASLSPDGTKIAMTEGIKLYTVTTAGAYTEIWLEENQELRPVGGVVWSPDGQFLAAVVEFKNQPCPPCRTVAVINMADGSITYLKTDKNLDTDAPRWTQDGRILVNAHPGEPAKGITYVFDRYGLGQPASGTYILSSSHDGQKWYPWLPGRIWRAGVSERADSYYKDE